jgi:hypothetical protein
MSPGRTLTRLDWTRAGVPMGLTRDDQVIQGTILVVVTDVSCRSATLTSAYLYRHCKGFTGERCKNIDKAEI